MSFSQHTVLYSSQKSRQVVKIIVNVELVVVVVMVVVVRLVVVNGWRRRGDKSTATAARPLPTTAIDQGGPASSQFNRLNPPTSCLQVQHTTQRLQEWRRTPACPEMSTLLILHLDRRLTGKALKNSHYHRIPPENLESPVGQGGAGRDLDGICHCLTLLSTCTSTTATYILQQFRY